MLDLAGISSAERMFTHAIACHPEDAQGRYRDPKQSEILKCWPRLKNLIDLLKPRLIVTAGVIATKTMGLCGDDLVIDGIKPFIVSISSPSQIVRNGGEDSISFSYAVVAIKKAWHDTQWKGKLDGKKEK